MSTANSLSIRSPNGLRTMSLFRHYAAAHYQSAAGNA
jgi:hypothetical protein